MTRTTLRVALVAIALASISGVNVRRLSAQEGVPAAGGPATLPGPMPLFYNYYTTSPGVPAQMYPMPRPVPANMGQVWITYPPLMPHEFLYHHHRRYYRYTPGGYTSATVRYDCGLLRLPF